MSSTIDPEILRLLRNSEHILVVTGAGISTGAGIIDFRSPGGLYETAKKRYNLPYAEAIFDINYFRRHPEPFFMLSRELIDVDVQPTACHRFLARLELTGKIEMIVTQNIDMLHEKAGSQKIIECHGSYRTGRCQSCGASFGFEVIKDMILKSDVPRCSCGGIIKPDVVFFGESLPEEFMKIYFQPPRADLLLVMGTSLTVQPVAGFALNMAPAIPSVLVNRDVGTCDQEFDYVYHGELDGFAVEAQEILGLT